MRNKLSTLSLQNGSPKTKNKTVTAKSELTTFYGIGTEEIRKSIETLDRILDQYDEGSSPSETRFIDKKFSSGVGKVDPAAEILASCFKTAGTHKLRKRVEEQLPPPPPELLQHSRHLQHQSLIARQVDIPVQPQQLGLPLPQHMDQQRMKCPPLVPKRGPETKLSMSMTGEQPPAWESADHRAPATAPANISIMSTMSGTLQHRNGRSSGPGVDKRHPESGYITPDQHDLIDSIFLSCAQQQTSVSRCHSLSDSTSRDSSSPSVTYPQPPVEFGDNLLRSQCSVDSINYNINVGPSKMLMNGDAVTMTGVSNDRRVPRSVDMELQAAQMGTNCGTGRGAFTKSSLDPYLACVIPPPPSSESLYNSLPSNTCLHMSIVDPSFLIVPPPPPVEPSQVPLSGTVDSPDDMRFRLSSTSSSSAAADGSPDSPTSTKLPPPPTLPKQLRNSSLPRHESLSPASTGRRFTPPDITKGLPGPAVPSNLVSPNSSASNTWRYNNDDDDTELFPPPPPSLCENYTSDLVASSLPLNTSTSLSVSSSWSSAGRTVTSLVSDAAQSLSGATVGRMCRGLASSALQRSSSGETDVQLRHPDIVPTTSRSSLNDQIHAGIQLRPTEVGLTLRSQSCTEYSSYDISMLPGYQEVPANCPVWKKAMIEKKNKQLEEDAMKELLARKQEEDRWRDIPEWKKSLLMEKEKKKQEEMVPYHIERQKYTEEVERLQLLPEWKRNLIIKKRGNDV